MNCLTNIVGYTRTECCCFSGEFTERAGMSKSGLYVDELPEFPNLKAFEGYSECGGIIEDAFVKAEGLSKKEFEENLYKELNEFYATNTKLIISSKVGNNNNSGLLTTNTQYIALAYHMQPSRGMYLKVKSVQPFFNQAQALAITVQQCYYDGTSYTYLRDAGQFTINTYGKQDIGLELPYTDENGEPYAYLFVYGQANGLKPRNNANTCNCGGIEADLHKQLYAYTTSSDDLYNFPIQKSGHIAGLMFYIETSCKPTDIICDNYNKDPMISASVDIWLNRQIAKNMMKSLQSSGEINRFTMLDGEMIFLNAKILSNQNKTLMKYIAQNIKVEGSPCLQCKPTSQFSPYHMQKGGIKG